MIQVGISGDVGSFSEEAALKYCNQNYTSSYNKINWQFQYLIEADRVLLALTENVIDIGILPIMNNNSGLVKPTIVAMGYYKFDFLDEIALQISQCLLAKDKIDLNKITSVYSYPPALKQCNKFLKKYTPQANIVNWSDTARASRDLAAGIIHSDCAVVGSIRAAKFYGLSILVEGVEDVQPNYTTFIVVKKSD